MLSCRQTNRQLTLTTVPMLDTLHPGWVIIMSNIKPTGKYTPTVTKLIAGICAGAATPVVVPERKIIYIQCQQLHVSIVMAAEQ